MRTLLRCEVRRFELLLRVLAEHLLTDFLCGFGAVFGSKAAGFFEFVDVFHDEVGNVELEAGAFQAEAFHADLLFAQADDKADDFAVEAGRDFVLGDDFHGAVDEGGDDGVFDGVGIGAGHEEFASGFGLFARLLEVDRASTARLFTFINLRGLLASAVRLGIIGPLEAQRLQFKLSPAAESTAQTSLQFTTADIAHTAPLLDIWQGAHNRLYSRLFQT